MFGVIFSGSVGSIIACQASLFIIQPYVWCELWMVRRADRRMGARPHYLDGGGGGEGSATLLHTLQYFLDREELEEEEEEEVD